MPNAFEPLWSLCVCMITVRMVPLNLWAVDRLWLSNISAFERGGAMVDFLLPWRIGATTSIKFSKVRLFHLEPPESAAFSSCLHRHTLTLTLLLLLPNLSSPLAGPVTARTSSPAARLGTIPSSCSSCARISAPGRARPPSRRARPRRASPLTPPSTPPRSSGAQ